MANNADRRYNYSGMVRRFSRMSRVQEKRNFRRAFLFMVGTFALIAFMATVGFSILAKMFIFFGDIKSGMNSKVEKTDLIPPGPPRLTISTEATNSAVFSVKGIAEPGSQVYLSMNTGEYESTKVPDEGIFEFSGISLEFGVNTFTAVAVDDAGNRSQSSTGVSVLYSSTPPKLEISSPTDQQTISGKENRVQVKGKTDSGVKITINERVAIVDSSGGFLKQVELIPGDNVFVILATDAAGNQARKELTVVYKP